MNQTNNLLLIILSSMIFNTYSYKINTERKVINENVQKIQLTFDLEPKEVLYKEGLDVSVNSADISLSHPTTTQQAASFFDQLYNANKEGYKGKVVFEFTATKKPTATFNGAIVHVHFMVNTDKLPQQAIVNLFDHEHEAPGENKNEAPANINVSTQPHVPEHPTSSEVAQSSWLGGLIRKIIDYIGQLLLHWRNVLSQLFTATGSRAIRLLVALVLGLLLSFTPCIYPMIPITIGVLQANNSKSGFKNFLLALCYTLGISVTFAILGLIAAFGSAVFGSMQGSPWVIIPLVVLLGYLGLAMFGLYEMHIPSFLRPKSTDVKGGSYLSAFTFGAISGTVASPCMSPGLALILDWVSNLSKTGSAFAYIEGFILLFVFGIGSSLPLLIIGTFTSSTSILPQAGLWMVEVKKILGLMLIAMCFYHLSHIPKYLPWYILIWLIVIALFAFGAYYFYTIYAYDTPGIKRFKNFMGTLLIVSGCIVSVQGGKAVYDHFYRKLDNALWSHDLNAAREKAVKENKKLLIDIGATYCGACKVIDSTVFRNEAIAKVLNNYVLVKIESDVNDETYESALKLFGDAIKKTGFPTILIVNPKDNEIIKHWGADIRDKSINDIVAELEKNK